MQASPKNIFDASVSDLLWGAEAIGNVIGKTTRATFHLLERGQLPAKKVGRQWVASKQKLIDTMLSGEAE